MAQRVQELEQMSYGRGQADEGPSAAGDQSYQLNIQAAYVVHGPDTKIITCNKLSQDLLGLTEKQMMGKMAIDPAWKFLDSQGQDMPPEKYPVNIVLDTKKPLKDYTLGICRPDRPDPVWVLINADPVFDQKENIRHVIVTFMDITQLKKAEEALRESEARMRSIFRAAPVGIGLVSDRILMDVNNRFCEMTGYSRDELVGQNARMVYPSDEDYEYVGTEKYRQIQAQGTGTVETRFKRKDGKIIDILMSSSPVNLDDLSEGVTFTALDITERKRTEVEKIRLEEQYQQAQKVESIGRLAGGVAHDLNNLLSPILGAGELLRSDLDPDDTRQESVDHIMNAGLRAREIVRQLLAFSRKQILKFKPVGINKIVKGFEKLIRRTIREDIEIHIITSPDVRTVMADVGQMEQVIMNLAVNAQDAMPEGGSLTIETKRVVLDENHAAGLQDAKSGPHTMLAIMDTGIGIENGIRNHLFEPFFSTKGAEGTGLGLATVYGIVKQHNGHIQVHSEPGKGSTFQIYLPETVKKSVKKTIAHKKTDSMKGSETILLVEDDKSVRHIAISILKRYGYRILTAETGPEALSCLSTHDGPVHLLLTDVVLPQMNGKELFIKATELLPDLKVLYMSGYTDDVIAHRGILENGIAFIEKPFTVRSLSTKVREVLDNN